MQMPTRTFPAMRPLAVACLLGAVVGLVVGFALVQVVGFVHFSSFELLFWDQLSALDEFWQWPLLGAGVAGLGYAAWRSLRNST
jgi:hypothetical protein